MLWLLIGWPAFALGLGLTLGPIIRKGMGADDPVQTAREAYEAAVERNDTRAMNATWQRFNQAKNAQLADEIHYRNRRRWGAA